MKRLPFVIAMLLSLLLLAGLAGCTGETDPEASEAFSDGPEVSEPLPTGSDASEAPSAEGAQPGASETPSAGDASTPVQLVIKASGAVIAAGDAGWSEELISQAVSLAWDQEISLTLTGGGSLSSDQVSVERAPLSASGLKLSSSSAGTAVGAGRGVTVAHTYYTGLWDLPASQSTVLTGYHITVSGAQQEYYFVVKSDFPQLENVSQEQELQIAWDGGNLLYFLSAEADVDGDGTKEAVSLAAADDLSAFLTVDGQVAFSIDNIDSGLYKSADLLAIDLNGDGRDEVAAIAKAPGFYMLCAGLENGVWRQYSLPTQEFSMSLAKNFTLQLTGPDGVKQTISAASGSPLYDTLDPFFDSKGTPYSTKASVTCILSSSAYTITDGGIQITAELELSGDAVDSLISDTLIHDYTAYLTAPLTISLRNGKLVASCGQPQPD